MSAADKFNAAKRSLQIFRSWKSLIGKEYTGGTRGKGGEYGEVVRAVFTCEIYHQEYDGATNYHRSNQAYQEVLNEAARQHASAILDTAEQMLAQKQMDAAIAAKTEALAIIEAAEGGPQS